jgi:hypothetical protein
MAKKDVLRLLRTLSRHADLAAAYQKSDANRKRIIKESGGISSTEQTLLLTKDPAQIKAYLDEEHDTAQQIQVD